MSKVIIWIIKGLIGLSISLGIRYVYNVYEDKGIEAVTNIAKYEYGKLKYNKDYKNIVKEYDGVVDKFNNF